MSEKIIAYKAMNKNMMCRGKQYEVGKTYNEDKADCCHAGMHACENPLDVLHYYPLKDSPRFFEVECGGDVDKSEGDSKLACTELTVKGELNFAGLVKATVAAVFNRVKGKESFSSGYYSTAGTSGTYSTAGTSGNYSTAGTSGTSSTAGTSGNYSTAGTSGNYSTAGTSGYRSTAGTSGYGSTAGTSGDYSTAGTSGNGSTAAATGSRCRAKVDGKDSIAVANGHGSKARGALGCYLVLTEYDDDGHMLCAKMARVDGSTVKEDVWYTLKNGEFVESET
nr:MAG TPA: hypothetical protein [Caudoviricetes sp.]